MPSYHVSGFHDVVHAQIAVFLHKASGVGVLRAWVQGHFLCGIEGGHAFPCQALHPLFSSCSGDHVHVVR